MSNSPRSIWRTHDTCITFGADFLGTWNSPVSQNVGYGEMRQGRPGQRGKLVQVEPRMSQTGANADEWVAIKPGTEGVLALGLAHVILQEKLAAGDAAGRAGAADRRLVRRTCRLTRPRKSKRRTGVAKATHRAARDASLRRHGPAVAIIGGAPLAHTNGLFNALAVNALNALVGSMDEPGGICLHAPAYDRGNSRQPSQTDRQTCG